MKQRRRIIYSLAIDDLRDERGFTMKGGMRHNAIMDMVIRRPVSKTQLV